MNRKEKAEQLTAFRLSNYSECKDYSLLEWATVLLGLMEAYNGTEEQQASLIKLLVNLCASYVSEDKIISHECFLDIISLLQIYNSNSKLSSYLIRLAETYCNKEPIEEAMIDELFQYIHSMSPAYLMEENASLTDERSIPVIININYPDSLISDAIAEIVNIERKRQGVTPAASWASKGNKFTEDEVRKWYNDGILPFICLVIWEKQTDNKLTQREKCIAIFGDFYEKKIPRLKEKVDRLMNIDRLHTLFMQATQEMKTEEED